MELSGLWLAIRFLAYPGFNEEFKIHTDASNFQLVLVISQYGKKNLYIVLKQTGDHKRYTVTEK